MPLQSIAIKIKKYRLILVFALIFSSGLAASSPSPNQEPIEILLHPDLLAQLSQGKPTLDNINYDSIYAKELVELALLHLALKKGGYRGKTVYVNLKDSDQPRTSHYLKAGLGTLSSEASASINKILPKNHKEIFHLTSALISSIDVGIYTSKEQLKAIQLNNMNDFNTLTAAVDYDWPLDIKFLESLSLKKIEKVKTWTNAYKMIQAGRINFCIAPFSNNDDLSNTAGGITLYPVANVKLSFPRDRRWLISRQHPAGEQAIKSIEKGLSLLRAEGIIRKSYVKAGVINESVNNWTVLNSAQTAENK